MHRSRISLHHIPHEPGVYIFKDQKDTILYIGKAKDLHKRVQQYFSPGSVRKQDMINKADRVDFIQVNTESEALYLEDNLIKKHQPTYNRLLKADNSYVFVKLTNEDFPQVLLTRQRKQDGATYIGPKNNSKVLKKLLQYLRQIYKFRTSNKSTFRKGELHSDYYFGLDAGRSIFAKLKQKNADVYKRQAAKAGLIINKSYQEYYREYQSIMRKIRSFFEGNTRQICKDIKQTIEECIQTQNFEYAAILKDIYIHIEQLTERQHVVLDPKISGKIVWITSIEEVYIMVIIQVFEGKMIDIIRQQYMSDDHDIHQLITACETDLGPMQIYKTDKTLQQAGALIPATDPTQRDGSIHSFLLMSKDMKKIRKKDRNAVRSLMEKFVDSYITSTAPRKNSILDKLLKELQSRYSLRSYPYTMECIDISHLSGGWMSGGLSHFQGGIPFRKNYRQYKIQSVQGNSAGYSDDYKALKEVIVRRYLTQSRTDQLPELCIIDGGKGQLQIIQELTKTMPEMKKVRKHTQFVSLGKGSARTSSGKSAGNQEILYSIQDNTIIEQKLQYDQTDKLLIQIRDEAHRFANRYRKKQMSMERKKKR